MNAGHSQPNYKRNHYRMNFRLLVVGIALILVLIAFSVTPIHAASKVEPIILYPNEGKIGERIHVEGSGFEEGKLVYIYFSSDVADEGDSIDGKVIHYKLLEKNIKTGRETLLHPPGEFDTSFIVPEELDDGEDKEDVHGGDYYVYVTYRGSKQISAVAGFTVIDGEIELDPAEGTVGTKVKISGEGLRHNQEITIKYEGDEVDIASGDTRTDSDGQFISTIIIPESIIGNHTITVTDESGNKPEAEFRVKPKITITPPVQTIDKTVEVSGTGFGKRERITITLDSIKISTTPISLYTNNCGNFNGSFVIPCYPDYTGGGTGIVEARDGSFGVAEAELTILAIPASVSIYPATSLAAPGHVGMELTAKGNWFIANTAITITYSNSEVLTVATAQTNGNGYYSATFIVPPSIAGSHAVTATDGTNSVTAVFTMESQKPLTPVPLLPKVATIADAATHFDWEDVTDPSSITYILQIATDDDFSTIVLEKKGLTDSEYTLTEKEKLKSTKKETPYYWRVKAIDDTFTESEWTTPTPFYVGISRIALPVWTRYIWIGVGGALAVILGFWIRKRKSVSS